MVFQTNLDCKTILIILTTNIIYINLQILLKCIRLSRTDCECSQDSEHSLACEHHISLNSNLSSYTSRKKIKTKLDKIFVYKEKVVLSILTL